MSIPSYRVKVEGFKASSHMLSTGILGFYFADDRLHYSDRHRNEETLKWIGLNSEEGVVFHKMLEELSKDWKNERAQNRLRGAVVTMIKYVRQFQHHRIRTET